MIFNHLWFCFLQCCMISCVGGQLLSLKPDLCLTISFVQFELLNLDWLVFFFFFSPLKHCCIVEQARCFLLNSHSFLNDSIWNINLDCSCCPANSSSIHSQVSYTAPIYRFWPWQLLEVWSDIFRSLPFEHRARENNASLVLLPNLFEWVNKLGHATVEHAC